ncbi:MAG: hypothetical protein ACYDIE_04885 [Candidatus Krumholzibacteriia bacterium]
MNAHPPSAARLTGRLSCLVLLLAATGACERTAPSGAPDTPTMAAVVTADYGDSLAAFLRPPAGTSHWTWHAADAAGDSLSGAAELLVSGRRATWRLTGDSPPPAPGRLRLRPAEPDRWHHQTVTWPATDPAAWLPLPRLPVDSAAYADLLDLLQRLTDPRFRQRVTHWPAAPLPLVAPPTLCGELDLADCLAEAVDLWNAGEPTPLFAPVPSADWGLRLAYIPDPQLTPRLALRVVASDSAGRPLRAEIVAGAGYATATVRKYAVRGMLHELAHARLLWGHSEERRHLLWKCGPIVDAPSADERRAARLWTLLPEGLDLHAYARSTEIDP